MRQLFLSDIFDIIYFEVCHSWYANLNFSLIGLIFDRIFDVSIEMFVQRGDNPPLHFHNIKVRIDKKKQSFKKSMILFPKNSYYLQNRFNHHS